MLTMQTLKKCIQYSVFLVSALAQEKSPKKLSRLPTWPGQIGSETAMRALAFACDITKPTHQEAFANCNGFGELHMLTANCSSMRPVQKWYKTVVSSAGLSWSGGPSAKIPETFRICSFLLFVAVCSLHSSKIPV